MRSTTLKRFILLLTALMLLSGIVIAAPNKPVVIQGNYDSIKDYLFNYIREEMSKKKIAGLSMALIDGDQTVLIGNFGYADLDQKKPVTEETLFRVGSISKLFTAVAIMQLAEAGKIDIDQPLQTYIPEFSIKTRFAEAGPITIRSIMTHHSGLPGDRLKDFFSPNPPYFTSLVADIKDEYTAYPPNYIWAYSNLGVSLLGVVVERVSGEKFSEYVDEHILKPMTMNHSSFQLREDMRPLFAKGYSDGKLTDEGYLRDLPAGGLYSNVDDLCQFITMIIAGGRSHDHEILKSKTIEAMLTPQNETIPLDLNIKIGLNWFLSDPQLEYGGKVAQHSGATNLYHSMLEILPEHQLGVIVLTNSNTGSAAVTEIAQEGLKLALEVKTGLKAPVEPELPAIKEEFPPEEQDRLVGDYATEMGLATINKAGRGLKLTFFGQNFKMIPREDGWFSIKPLVLGFIPWRVKELDNLLFTVRKIGQTDVVILNSHGNQVVIGEPVQASPISEAWRKRLGQYRFIDQQNVIPVESVQLKVERELLLADFLDKKGKSQACFVLTPMNDEEAVVRGLGRSMHETLRVIKLNNEEVLSYSAIQMKKVNK